MNKLILTFAALFIALNLSGCGLKRDLKLPKDDPKQKEQRLPAKGGSV